MVAPAMSQTDVAIGCPILPAVRLPPGNQVAVHVSTTSRADAICRTMAAVGAGFIVPRA